jgi:hypothetical protein
MTKQLSIDVTDKQYDLMKRIAKSCDRKLDDLIRLVFAEGLIYYWCEDRFCFKKTDDEFTEEERKQLAKNKEIEEELDKEHKNPNQLSKEEQEKLGFKYICEFHYGGGFGPHDDDDETPNLCYVLNKEIKQALLDQEEN